VPGAKLKPWFMNPVIRILIFVLSLSSILSFLKHPNTDPGPKGAKLYKIYMWNSKQPFQNIDIFEYHYDSLNRVTEIKQYLLDSLEGNRKMKFIKSQTCFYNGSEQLPYKTKGFHYYAEKEIYYFYDSSGRLITDSMSTVIGNDYYAMQKYNWGKDKFIREIRSQFVGKEDSSVIINHNIISNVLTKHGASHIAYTHAKLTFDSKINPLNTLNISPMLITLSWPYATYEQQVSGYNRNNITEMTLGRSNFDTEFTPKFKYSYTYKYNNAGLPVECEISGVPFSKTKDRISYYYID
jgi:hypothetical protein